MQQLVEQATFGGLTLQELKKIYKDTELEDNCSILFKEPENEQDFIENFIASKLWRLNNLYKIINKEGKVVTMHMKRAQHIVYAYFLKHPRLIILKSRQQGISTLWLVFFFDTLIFFSTRKAGLMSQGLDESAELLDKLTVLWDNMDPEILNELGLSKRKDNSKMFELSNGSKMLVRTSFRSGTLQMLHISEYGKIANAFPARAEEVKTGSLQAIAKGLPVIIESTAEGVNEFKYMWDTAVAFIGNITGKDFMPVFLPWTDDPDCTINIPQEQTMEGRDYFNDLEREYNIICNDHQKWFWEAQFRELGVRVYQEYPATPVEAFKAALEGSYYGSYVARYITRKQNRIRDNLYDPSLPITISADLGLDDDTVLFFWQYFGLEHRLIGEYTASGKQTSHYIKQVKYMYPEHKINHIILPHDASKRDNSNLITREKEFSDGFKSALITKLPKSGVLDGINIVRTKLQHIVLDRKCIYALECLQNYSKERDEKRNVWRDYPNHDEFSHGADNIRYYCIGERNSYRKRAREVPRDSFEV